MGPGLIIAGKSGVYPCGSYRDRLLALPEYSFVEITTNALAYYDTKLVMPVKAFITVWSDTQHFIFSKLTYQPIKVECYITQC